MFDDLSFERRKEIRAVKSEEEYAKLTPHEKCYYRLTEPILPSRPPMTEEEIANLSPEKKAFLDQIEKWYNLNQPQKDD